jgi:hypothetical protein
MNDPWKGNIRELKSAVEKALLLAAGEEITAEDLFGRTASGDDRALDVATLPTSFRDAKQRVVDEFERAFLVAALARNAGNISRTAEEIGMYRQNLQQKIRELGLEALSIIDGAEAASSRVDACEDTRAEGPDGDGKRRRKEDQAAAAADGETGPRGKRGPSGPGGPRGAGGPGGPRGEGELR